MAQSTERTRLLMTVIPQPEYNFSSSITRERKRRVKQFQCCLCAILLVIFLIASVITVIYSIEEELNNNSTSSDDDNNITTNMPEVLLITNLPLTDVPNRNGSVEDIKLWEQAVEEGEKGLLTKDEIERNLPSLQLRSPSYRHQRVTATTEKGRNVSKRGFVEEYATRHLHKNNTLNTVVELLCPNGSITLGENCDNKIIECNVFYKYRNFNGTCNNLKKPLEYGVAYRPFRRMLPPNYADGISKPRVCKTGAPLPSARTVSLVVHRPYYKDDPKFSVMLATWGQFLDHDITATALSQKSNGSTISCCDYSGKTSPECFPVLLDENDPYREYNFSCIEFVRSAPASTCCLGPREQLNQVTSFIDGSVVYSADEEYSKKLRDTENGTMKVYTTSDGRKLLPVSEDMNDGCNRDEEEHNGKYCFMTGDARANENLHLTTMHLIWVRQHNNIASKLTKINPHWNDEEVFQETKRIVAAQIQHITYNEFLPILLGTKLMKQFDLLPTKTGYFNKYNDSIDPNIANCFATAAFRFAHSIIPGLMKFLANDTSSPEFVRMRKMLFNPFRLYEPGELDKTLRGAMNTAIEASDSYFTEELKSHMFEMTSEQIKKPKLCGLDLVSLNVQRGRDHGLPGYGEWRRHCGLKVPKNFSDLKNYVDRFSFRNMQAIYSEVDDIDLYTGALSEKPLKKSILGPTITCLLLDQFYRLKHGDRFWYENPQKPLAFTLDQLNELKKTTLANIICDNADNLKMVQKRVMERVGNQNYVNCSDLDKTNFELWKEELHHININSDEAKISIMKKTTEI